MKFSFDELKEKLNRETVGAWVVRYKRQVAVVLIVIVLLIVAAAGNAGSSDDTGDEQTELAEESTEEETSGDSGEEGEETEVSEEVEEEDGNPLEKDAYPEVNELVQQYYDYIAAGDVEGLAGIEDETDEEEQERILRSTDLVEGYQNISCYTKKGLEDGSYLVFVYYELKFYQIETAAPGVSPLYIYTNDEGSLVIFNGEASDELNAYVEEMAAEEDVIALMEEVSEAYAAAKASDTDLAELEERYLRIAAETSSDENEASEDEEAAEETDAEDAESDTEDAEDAETDTEDAEDAETDTEDAETDEGTEDAATDEDTEDSGDTDADDAGDGSDSDTGTATAQNRTTRFTESVKLRSEPSTDGEYLGTAYQGESVTEIESYENGWSKISYNGTECYCMTQYLE